MPTDLPAPKFRAFVTSDCESRKHMACRSPQACACQCHISQPDPKPAHPQAEDAAAAKNWLIGQNIITDLYPLRRDGHQQTQYDLPALLAAYTAALRQERDDALRELEQARGLVRECISYGNAYGLRANPIWEELHKRMEGK